MEARIKACRSPRILHLATHGFFLANQRRDLNLELRGLGLLGGQAGDGFGQMSEMPSGRMSGPGMENPLLRSGVILAGFKTWRTGGSLPAEAEDGLLTAEDVSGLDLLATELVVLSACETGLGEVRTGKGVFGLRRAFVLARVSFLRAVLLAQFDQLLHRRLINVEDCEGAQDRLCSDQTFLLSQQILRLGFEQGVVASAHLLGKDDEGDCDLFQRLPGEIVEQRLMTVSVMA
jgi:hypothetical protein